MGVPSSIRMSKKPPPYEFFLLKSRDLLISLDKPWKVTARYTVRMGADTLIPCVRVRGYHDGNAIVRHFSEEEFKRLFKKAPKE